MAMDRPNAELVLSEEEQAQLAAIARSRSMPAALVQRASIVLACAAGATNSAVAGRFGTTQATVGKWRRRFVEGRIAGLHDEVRPGRPRSIDDERIAELLTTTLHRQPGDGATHCSVRSLAAETSISKTSVHRFLRMFELQRHRQDSFKLSNDPFFIEKLRDPSGAAGPHTPHASGCTSTRPTRRWSCASTKRAIAKQRPRWQLHFIPTTARGSTWSSASSPTLAPRRSGVARPARCPT